MLQHNGNSIRLNNNSSMWLDRALQFHVAALAVLGAIFVGLRHEATVVPALAAIAAVAAFLVTDVLAWVRLNRWAAEPNGWEGKATFLPQ